MSEWINSRDLLPPIGTAILVSNNNKIRVCIMNLCMIEHSDRDQYPVSKSLDEMHELGFLWTAIPELPK